MNDFRNNPWTTSEAAPARADQGPWRAEQQPAPSQPRTVSGSRPAGTRRPRSSRHHGHGTSSSRRKIRTLKLLLALLVIVLVIAAASTSVLWNRYRAYRGEAIALTATNQQLKNDLTDAQDNLTRLNNDLRILLSNRIPGVTGIQLNRQLEINDRYFRSITLSRSGVGDEGGLEFHAVLQNQRSEPVLPSASILLFDARGLQTASVRLEPAQSITPVESPELQPQETRTYSGKFETARNGASKYFLVQLD